MIQTGEALCHSQSQVAKARALLARVSHPSPRVALPGKLLVRQRICEEGGARVERNSTGSALGACAWGVRTRALITGVVALAGRAWACAQRVVVALQQSWWQQEAVRTVSDSDSEAAEPGQGCALLRTQQA